MFVAHWRPFSKDLSNVQRPVGKIRLLLFSVECLDTETDNLYMHVFPGLINPETDAKPILWGLTGFHTIISIVAWSEMPDPIVETIGSNNQKIESEWCSLRVGHPDHDGFFKIRFVQFSHGLEESWSIEQSEAFFNSEMKIFYKNGQIVRRVVAWTTIA